MKIIEVTASDSIIKQGKIIAYPTEAVYGLGCDPFNENAVARLLVLKNRSIEKGLIILISNWEQLFTLIDAVPDKVLDRVRSTWPGPVSWIFPKSKNVPDWLTGTQKTIAIRMSAHPVAAALSRVIPIVSTSANITGANPALSVEELMQQFPSGIDALVQGELGGAAQPSAIYDVLTQQRLR